MDIGTRVRSARETLDYTQEELAQAVGLSRYAVIEIEAGQRSVKVEELCKIAAELERPLDYFLTEEYSDRLAVRVLRGDAATPEAARAELWLQRRLGDYAAVCDRIGVETEPVYEPVGISDEMIVSVANASARAQRDRFNIGTEPIHDLRSFVEAHVCIPIFGRKVHDADFLGMLMFRNSQHATGILANSRLSTSRRNFTIAHEWGHLVWKLSLNEPAPDIFCREEADNEEEMFANAFAAQVLAPDEGIREHTTRAREFGGVDSPEFVQWLASKFGVSFAAMTYRLQNVGLLASERGQALRETTQVRTLKHYRSEMSSFADMSPLYQHCVLRAFDTGALSAARCGEMLDITAVEFMELVDGTDTDVPQEAAAPSAS